MDVAVNPWVRGAAWVLAALTLSLLGVALAVQAGVDTGSSLIDARANSLMLLSPLISALVGAVVIDRKGSHPVGWLFAFSGLGWAIYQLGYATGLADPATHPSTLRDLLTWSTTWSSFIAFGLAPILVLYVFPTGRLASRGWRWGFAGTVGAIVLGALGYTFAPGPMEDLPAIANPYGASGALGGVFDVLAELAWPMFLVASAAGVMSLRQRSRQGTFDERQQIKWLLLAGVTLLAFSMFWGVVETLGRPEIAAAAAGVFLSLLPIALGIAILRHRLYDIDVLINRTLVYATLSAVLAVVYLGTVVVFQRLLSTFTADSNIAIAASTLAVAALFRPVRAQIQQFIDRRFYRQKYNAAATVGRFSTRLRHEIDLDALEGELLAVVAQTLQPNTAAVWLRASETPS